MHSEAQLAEEKSEADEKLICHLLQSADSQQEEATTPVCAPFLVKLHQRAWTS